MIVWFVSRMERETLVVHLLFSSLCLMLFASALPLLSVASSNSNHMDETS
jgi:hypothetical protein